MSSFTDSRIHATIDEASGDQNDVVSVAGTLGIATLQSQTEQFLDYFLDTQGSDGWLGPEVNSTQPRQLSPRHDPLRSRLLLIGRADDTADFRSSWVRCVWLMHNLSAPRALRQLCTDS